MANGEAMRIFNHLAFTGPRRWVITSFQSTPTLIHKFLMTSGTFHGQFQTWQAPTLQKDSAVLLRSSPPILLREWAAMVQPAPTPNGVDFAPLLRPVVFLHAARKIGIGDHVQKFTPW